MFTRKKTFLLWCSLYFAIPLFILFIGRVVFLLYYRNLYAAYSLGQVVSNFLHGFRFDFALVAFLYGVPFLLILILPIRWQILGLKILSILALPINLVIAFIQTVGIGYFEETGRHLSFEVLFLFSDFPALTQVALKDYRGLVFFGLFVLASLVILFFIIFYFFSKKKIAFTIRKTMTFFDLGKEIFKRVAIFLLIVLFARGGWQLKPLNITHAFYHGDQILGSLAFGTPFSLVKFLSSLSKPLVSKQWLSNEKAISNSQNILAGNKDIFLSKEYPFYRRLDFENQEAKKKNLVVIVMESWGANYIAALEGNNKETTPFFNELSKKGMLFENFFAVGNRSIQGVSSVMFSLPSIEKLPIYKTPFAANRMPSLPLVLSQAGYESIFFHAGHEGSLYLHNLAKLAQYEKVFSLSNVKNTKERYDGTWGLWDHFAFLDFSKELSKLKTPFHGMFFSLTSHTPYSIPNKDFEYFSKDIHDYQFLNSLRYSDWALKQFFLAAQQYDWYYNTIFFILADHNRGFFENKKLNYQIPLLIFSPDAKNIAPGKNKIIGSQIDILPTALSLLKINFPFSAAGKDLFSVPIETSYALVSTNKHRWITSEYIYFFEENSLEKVIDFQTSQTLNINQQDKIHKKNIDNFLSFFQTSFHVILDNKIVPTL